MMGSGHFVWLTHLDSAHLNHAEVHLLPGRNEATEGQPQALTPGPLD